MDVSQELALLRAQLDMEKRANEELKMQRGEWLVQMERTLRESQDALLTQRAGHPPMHPSISPPVVPIESEEDAPASVPACVSVLAPAHVPVPAVSPHRNEKRVKRGINLLSPPIPKIESPKESYEEVPRSPSRVPPLSPTGQRLPPPRPLSPVPVTTYPVAVAPIPVPLPMPMRMSSPIVLSPTPYPPSPTPVPAPPPLPISPLPQPSPMPLPMVPLPVPTEVGRCESELPPPRQDFPFPVPMPPPVPFAQNSNISPPLLEGQAPVDYYSEAPSAPLEALQRQRELELAEQAKLAHELDEQMRLTQEKERELLEQQKREAEMQRELLLEQERRGELERQQRELDLELARERELLEQQKREAEMQREQAHAELLKQRELLTQQREADYAALMKERELVQEKQLEANLVMAQEAALEEKRRADEEEQRARDLQKREADLALQLEQERVRDLQKREAEMALQMAMEMKAADQVTAQAAAQIAVEDAREAAKAANLEDLEMLHKDLTKERELLEQEQTAIEQGALAEPSRYVPPTEAPNGPSDVARCAWEGLVAKTGGELSSTELALMSLGTLKELIRYYGIVNPVECARIEVYWRLMHDKLNPAPSLSPEPSSVDSEEKLRYMARTPTKVNGSYRPPWRSVNYRTPRHATPSSTKRTASKAVVATIPKSSRLVGK